MKLQRTTLILILLTLGLGGFVYFYEIKGATQREEVKEKKQHIFSFAASDLQSLMVKTQNLTINLERSHNSGKTQWFLQSPTVEPANDAVVSYLIDALVKGKESRTLSIPTHQLGEFGLDQPQSTIDVKLKNQTTHKLILGKPDFTRRFLYAIADPAAKPSGNTNVLLVSTDFQNAVNRQLSEWKQTSSSTPAALPPVDDAGKKPMPSTDQPTPANSK